MRDIIIGASLLVIAALSWILVMTTDSNAESHSNKVMKDCLVEYGYTPEKFEGFDFSKPAACHGAWRVAENERDYKKMKDFLVDHPWYKGKNWKWEERAEYSCEKIYSTQLMNTITVCSKPIYLN